MAVNPPLMGTGQQRMQTISSQFEPRLVDRDLLPSTEMMASADPRQIHIASHLGPTVPQHTNMPNILSNRVYPGYSFLQPESMEAVARRQELVQKQNIARMEMEMSALFQQKEMEKAHRKGLLGLEAPFLYHGMPASPIAFRGRHRLPEGHLPGDLYVHRTTLDEIHGNTMLMAAIFSNRFASRVLKTLRLSFFLTGAHGLILNGEDISTIEDIRKWTVDDVYNFIGSLPGCSDYAQIFKDHAIDGETLPLLTEEHLLDTMGLKLGPALKIRSQVSRRLGNVLYMMNLPLSVPLPSAPGKPSDQPSDIASPLHCNSSGDALDSPCSQGPEASKTVEQIVSESRENPCDTAGSQADFQMITFQKS
uniref:Sterile alpha motif domain containing 7 n=1 Tax=Anas platyrhynchos platyrhynchos TaxID=8840 RepID=U3IKL3_ANAPP